MKRTKVSICPSCFSFRPKKESSPYKRVHPFVHHFCTFGIIFILLKSNESVLFLLFFWYFCWQNSSPGTYCQLWNTYFLKNNCCAIPLTQLTLSIYYSKRLKISRWVIRHRQDLRNFLFIPLISDLVCHEARLFDEILSLKTIPVEEKRIKDQDAKR